MADAKKKMGKFRLAILFAAVVFLNMLLATIAVFAIILILQKLGLYALDETARVPLFMFALVSLSVGTVFAFLLSKIPLKPIHAVCDAADRIAAGDYSVRLHLKSTEELKRLSDSFNHMATELGSVEMLRSDFVNNFSHEFKTPIVSIRGFAKMLKRDDLTAEEREEYLTTIITESERLASLSTNVLTLSKLEQQTILTGRQRVNVSEQLRQAMAVMYGKWAFKNLCFRFDCGERYVSGNDELLRQVWTNLLDNAAKFSPDGGEIAISIVKKIDALEITIQDHGCGIREEALAHIFDKFYQADASHAAKGNGLGLAIAHRIVQLHHGSISVRSQVGVGTSFVVSLPEG